MERARKDWVYYTAVIAVVLFATLLGNKTVETVSEMIPMERQHHIVIDPGHGGEDGGAVSCTGKNESNFNLQISLRLNDLCHLLGYDTVMIRATDTAVYSSGTTIAQKKVSDLKNRVKIVERTGNAVLLSIHQNTFPQSQYSGAQVFYANSPGSKALAQLIQDGFLSTLNPGSSRRIKEGSGIYLLEQINAPGVLIECGFLSNPEEEAKLSSPDYQKHLCCVIASCVGEFVSNT